MAATTDTNTELNNLPVVIIDAGPELVERYLAPLAATKEISPHLHVNRRVVASSRRGMDKTHSLGRERQAQRAPISSGRCLSDFAKRNHSGTEPPFSTGTKVSGRLIRRQKGWQQLSPKG